MLLTPDQEMIREAVRDFAQRELWPHAAEWDKKHHFPKSIPFWFVETRTNSAYMFVSSRTFETFISKMIFIPLYTVLVRGDTNQFCVYVRVPSNVQNFHFKNDIHTSLPNQIHLKRLDKISQKNTDIPQVLHSISNVLATDYYEYNQVFGATYQWYTNA